MSTDFSIVIPCRRDEDEEEVENTKSSLPGGTKVIVVAYDEGNLGAALNAGAEAASTPYIMVLHPGDMTDKHCLPFLQSLAWNVDCTYPSFTVLDENGIPEHNYPASVFCPVRLSKSNFIHRDCFLKVEAIKDVGGWRMDLEAMSHWDLYLRMAKAGKTFKAVREAIVVGYTKPSDWPLSLTTEKREEIQSEIAPNGEIPKATFFYQLSFPTTYYRCLLPAKYLPASCYDLETYEIEFSDNEDETTLKFPDHTGVGIFQFPGDALRMVMVKEMEMQGIRTLIEVDDNYTVTTPHPHSGWVKKIGDKGSSHSLEGHCKIVAESSGVIVSTPHLGSFYKQFGKPIYVCPNQIEPDDYPKLVKPDDGKIRIGWFASGSHKGDAYLIERALRWAGKQDNVEVIVMGLYPDWWGDSIKFTHYPWSNDLSVYHALISNLDIGLAPVRGDPWSLSRSDLKALDYGIQDVCPIISNNAPYYMWTHEENCLKATSPKEFYYYVKRLIEHPEEAREISSRAKEYILKERTIERNVWRWQEAIEFSKNGKSLLKSKDKKHAPQKA
mgnify:CR=1 FL=1